MSMKDASVAVFALLMATACGDPNGPSPVAVVTFGVAGETFRVALTRQEQVAAARAAQDLARARFPIGRIVAGTQVNAGWSWHLEDLEFMEVTIDRCDGRPSDVEREGVTYGGGRFCPWSAVVIRIEES
jgi:hypothetical protein